jgi:D-alanyl-D-alanine carboxypeptidase (penicillin-binding protein 5/6)
MSRFRPARSIGVTAGALAILAIGVYGPATLLGPLPAVTATLVAPPAAAANPSPPALPKLGGSAVIAQDDAASPGSSPLAVGGSVKALPMASAAKIVTALVVLAARPLPAGQSGPAVSISTADYQSYIDYGTSHARTVVVFPGEKWTELELLQAMILGSSNNHADTLARWAYGSVDAYLAAANAWLAAHGLARTHLADATGLHDASVGTAADLARLAGLAQSNPVVAGLLATPASALVGQRGVDNTTAYLPSAGITGISRSYTDAAGVCFLFTAKVAIGESSFSFAGAFIGEPDYDTLTRDLKALMKSAKAGVGELPILAKGDAYARFEAPWGGTASGVVRVAKTRAAWQPAVPGHATVTLDSFSTGRSGTIVGRVAVDAAGGSVSAPLVLDHGIDDPGPGWRLLNPVPMIAALIQSTR